VVNDIVFHPQSDSVTVDVACSGGIVRHQIVAEESGMTSIIPPSRSGLASSNRIPVLDFHPDPAAPRQK
jgi:hypothetical protein